MEGLKRIAISQMRSSTNISQNAETIRSHIQYAKENGALMAFFPENFNFLGRLGSSVQHAQPLNGPYMEYYKQLAREFSIWLSLGGFQESVPETAEKVFNSHIIINDSGEIIANYHKLHLFDVHVNETPLLESIAVKAGSEIHPPVDSPAGKLGLTICYDLRFPELYRNLALQGAQVLLVPAAFLEVTGRAHWEVLLRARAIENGCFVIASAQEGHHDCGRDSYGHSLAIDPWGTIIADGELGEKVLLVDIDLSLIEKTRRKLPTLSHVRSDVYYQRNK
ncbi:unnamed protein product [Blepharisma stoltei]|uniref:CN hydrolase domain-containing protein n=1 Tax=Blepharisma stoltei TaxID=1481888 RepID=A0AAU9JEC3_9CILI|nr:unnamed protein product [Blepharisma stoltei]